MKQRRTMLLLALNLALAMVASVAFIQFDNARSNAQRDQQDAALVLQDLQEIAAVHRPLRDGSPPQELTAGLQTAASSSGIAQQLQSIDAGPSRGGDEVPSLTVRLGAVTLEQLRQFLTGLQTAAQPLASTNIHLTVPQGPDAIAAGPGETWTAEVALQPTIGDTSR